MAETRAQAVSGPRAASAETIVVRRRAPPGLSAAYHLGEDSILLEQNQRVGGWCRSVEQNGFTFDYAGHIMFSNEPYVHQLYQMLLGDNVHWQDREAWIYSKDVYTRYPFQGALYGLPPQVIKECIVGADRGAFRQLEAAAQSEWRQRDTLTASQRQLTATESASRRVKDCCADGILEASRAAGGEAAGGRRAARRGISRSSSTRCGARASPNTSPFPITASSGQCRFTEMETILAGRPRTAARSRGDDRGRALSRAETHGA